MEPLRISRKDYHDGVEKVGRAVRNNTAYLDQFTVEFPDGMNTASALEICRCIEDSSLENKIHIAKICMAGKLVKVTCPNGEEARFVLSSAADSLEGFEIFQKDPLALWAIADTVYGYLLKKSVRPAAEDPEEQTPHPSEPETL